MKKKLFSLLAAVCLLALALAPAAGAARYLDEIERYGLTVTLREDGSADLVYEIRWKVLDSSSEGPLEWAKVGVPNENIDELTALSGSIRRISPYHEGGSYVRLDLDRSYHAGETVELKFSLHATHLYEINEDGSVNYEFTPGWFDAAETGEWSLTWLDGGGGEYSLSQQGGSPAQRDASTIPGGAQIVCKGLPAGGRVTLTADYPDQSGFAAAPLDPEQSRTYAESSGGGVDMGQILLTLLFTAFVIWMLTRRFAGDYWLGGFGGFFWPHHHHHHHGPGPGGVGGPGAPGGDGFGGFGGGSSRGAGAGRRSSGSGHSGGCACACVSCACACACAGGGRAGCSAKEFRGGAAIDTGAVLAALSGKTEGEDAAHGQ